MLEQNCRQGISCCRHTSIVSILTLSSKSCTPTTRHSKLPYVVVANRHLSLVHELYYKAFEKFRSVPKIRTVEDNARYCETLNEMLREHLMVIPNLAMGILECAEHSDELDRFMDTLLRAV